MSPCLHQRLYFLAGPTQIRCAHTDVRVPDFTSYRKSATLDPAKKAEHTEASRKSFAYAVAACKCSKYEKE